MNPHTASRHRLFLPASKRGWRGLAIFLASFIALFPAIVRANVAGGVVPGSPDVTVTDGGSTVTLSNGTVSFVMTKSSETISQINYTYKNGNGTKTTQLLNGGFDGGKLYWELGNFGGGSATYSLVVDPAVGDANHAPGDYAEIELLSTSSSNNGTVDMHFSMLRGSPGFYVTATWSHRATDLALSIGETRTNIYVGSMFNWMSVDAQRNKLMDVSANDTGIAVFGAPQECALWIDGIYEGRYEDKYKYSATFANQRAWGWSSVGPGNTNIGLWDVSASMEYYNGGPLKRELMCHHTVAPGTGGSTLLNMFNGFHYDGSQDAAYANGEVWTKTYGPYFVYCNNTAISNTNTYLASQALYNDALQQAAAEAPAWPYSWYHNANYASASARGTVTGKIVISDTGNPNASAANLWVNLVQQPITSNTNSLAYDFQQWLKPYEFWVKTDANGNFTVPSVISGSNYTLYAFGPGAEDEFMSQNQTGGNPQLLYNLPATPFSVTVNSGSTTNLGTITWKPTRVGPTVFEIGFPDRTATKFKHGDDYWVGDIGPSPTAPAPVWQKFLEYPYDYPSGVNYVVGKSRWATDWNYVQPPVVNSAGSYSASSSTITFTLPSAPLATQQASLYLGLCSAYKGLTLVQVNGTNLGTASGVTATPMPLTSSGFNPAFNLNDSTVREGVNSIFTDERLNFPGNLLVAGTNTITVTMNQGGDESHIMYDYLRLELSGYVPPAPATTVAYPGNNCALVAWPVTPGATSYNISRSTTSGANYALLQAGVTGPTCGSGTENATFLDTSATNGSTYFYEVSSVNPAGASVNSPQSAAVAPSSSSATSAPAAPANLTVTPGNKQVALSWTASAGANYYLVQRSTLFDNGGGFYNTLGTVTLTDTATGTSYTDTSPTNGSTYSYTVAAVNASGSSSASTPANAIPLTAAPTVAPTLTAKAGTAQITLNWNSIATATGYVVSESTSATGPFTLIGTISELTYTGTGLTTGGKYYFTVAATNFGGTSALSNIASATTLPPAPSSVTATGGNQQVTLTWPAVSGATSYLVGRGTATGGPFTNEGNPAGPSFVDSGLTNAKTYFYVVQTVTATGTSANSTPASATTTAAVPVAPTNLTATSGTGSILLQWLTSANATGYRVFRSSTTGGPYTLLTNPISGTTSTDTAVLDGAIYYYVVTATNASGSSANSNEASGSTLARTLIPLVWDNAGASPTNPADGSGAWNTSSSLWSSGTADSAWNNSNYTSATFGHGNGAGGTVTVGAVTAGGLIFNAPGSGSYTLSSGTVTLTGPSPSITANANATISSTILRSGTLNMSGTGSLSFTTPASLSSSPLNLTHITVDLNGASLATVLGTGTANLNGATIVSVTANPSTGVIANPIHIDAGNTGTLNMSSRSEWLGSSVTGSGSLNIVLNSNIGGQFRDDFLAFFDQFTGTVNITAGAATPGAGVRYMISSNNADGSPSATWNIGATGPTVNIAPVTDSGGDTLQFGALTGGTSGTLLGGASATLTSSGMITYSIGALGLNTNFPGAITGNAAITKVGGGVQILSGPCTYTGPTAVQAGILEITGTLTKTSGLTVAGGAEFFLSGGTLSVSGTITNNGLFMLSGSTSIASTGNFINNGVLDVIESTSGLPPNLVNNGTILQAGNIAVKQATYTGSNFNLTIQSFAQHTYQLQSATSLNPSNWAPIGAPQTGDGTVLTFSDTPAGPGVFYRVMVY